MRYRYTRKIAQILLITIILTGLSACATAPSPADTIFAFAKAYNTADIEAMLDCVDPTIVKGVYAAVELIGGLVGIDMMSILKLLPLALPFLEEYSEQSYPVMYIEIQDEVIEGNLADVYAIMTVEADGVEESVPCIFLMENIEGKWYIMNVIDG